MDESETRSSSTPSIALFGLFGSENFGNDASLVAMLSYLRTNWPSARISAVCSGPTNVSRDFGIEAVPIKDTLEYVRSPYFAVRAFTRLFVRMPRAIRTWYRTISYMRSFDLLIIPGTGILDDYAVTWDDLPYSLFRWCLSARLAGARVAFVSIGAGPINHPASRWLMTTSTRLASYRSFRDQMSKDYMFQLGVDTGADEVYPDLVFRLPTGSEALPHTAGHRPLVVGIGVMTYYGWHNDPAQGSEVFGNYVQKVADFVLWLLHEDFSVRFVIGEASDERAAEAILDRVRQTAGPVAEERLVFEPMRSVEDIIHQIGKTDLMVATRFHNFVFSIVLEKPVILLSYTERSVAMHKDAGLGGYSQQIEQFELPRLVEQFVSVRDNLPSLQQKVGESRHQFQHRLHDQLEGPLRIFISNDCESGA